jgi:hypothetical protein
MPESAEGSISQRLGLWRLPNLAQLGKGSSFFRPDTYYPFAPKIWVVFIHLIYLGHEMIIEEKGCSIK